MIAKPPTSSCVLKYQRRKYCAAIPFETHKNSTAGTEAKRVQQKHEAKIAKELSAVRDYLRC
eukprot:2506150-Amphidinium_carterae.1